MYVIKIAVPGLYLMKLFFAEIKYGKHKNGVAQILAEQMESKIYRSSPGMAVAGTSGGVNCGGWLCLGLVNGASES